MKKKIITLLPIVCILFQCCVVYQKTSVPLSDAYDKGKVEVISNTGEKLKYKKIISKDSAYYGIIKKTIMNDDKRFERVDIAIQLNADAVKAIFLKDKSKSTWATILLVPAAYGVFIIGVVLWGLLIGFGG